MSHMRLSYVIKVLLLLQCCCSFLNPFHTVWC